MKISVVALSSLVLASVALAQTPVTRPGAKKTTEKPAKKAEEPGKIEGLEIPRGEGFMGLQIANANFRLTFYDAKKKPVAADVSQAVLRWQPTYQRNEERVLLERSADGKVLTSPRVIRPPYNFKLYMTLFKEPVTGAEAVAAENFVVDFSQ